MTPDLPVAAGYGLAKITPDRPLALAGIAGVRHGRRTLDDLYVRAVVLRQGATTLVLVAIDTLYVSRAIAARLEAWLLRTHHIAAAHLFLAATHTHCAPLLLPNYFDDVPLDEPYVDLVVRQAQAAIELAVAGTRDVAIAFAATDAPVSINRRAMRWDVSLRSPRPRRIMANRPNHGGPVDNRVRVIWLRRPAADEYDVAIISVGCHPSILRGEVYSADFPGRIERHLNESRSRPVRVVFLQGFSGDTRPRLLESPPPAIWPPRRAFDWLFDRERFRKDSAVEDADAVAKAIADAVPHAAEQEVPAVMLRATKREVLLPLAESPDREEMSRVAFNDPRDANRRRARFVLDAYASGPTASLLVHTWSLSGNLHLVGLEGEVFCGYSLPLPASSDDGEMTVPVGCVGGMVGYIPTADALAKGGYEVDRSRSIFGVPSRFGADIDPIVRSALKGPAPHTTAEPSNVA